VDIDKLLQVMVEKGASDLFITAGVPPSIKIHGRVVPVTTSPLSPEKTRETVLGVMNESQRRDFVRDKECNFAISARGIGRFRVSAFYQRNLAGMVLRRIETTIPRVEDLGLPEIIKDLSMTKRGLVVFVGATGAGKSTSLAAMIGHRNRNSKGHIISVEDPIEYIHQHAGCIVTQREVGIDTESFEVGLKNMLRQAPDVIMIGEVRTRETMEHAITFAETGHLCLCTLHANNANQALDRILHFFPADRHSQLWMDLSLNLKAMVAQQLIPTPDGKGRRACVEILINTPLAKDLIRKGKVHELKGLMSKSNELGMQTFDQALYELYSAGEITYEDALAHADSANDLRLMIKLADGHATEGKIASMAGDLSLENEAENNPGQTFSR
jgi:twitching motility protein PilU